MYLKTQGFNNEVSIKQAEIVFIKRIIHLTIMRLDQIAQSYQYQALTINPWREVSVDWLKMLFHYIYV